MGRACSLLLALAALGAGACGSSLDGMIQDGRYDAAIAQVVREEPAGADRVARALDAALDPAIEIDFFGPAEIERCLGTMPVGLAPWAIAHVRVRYHGVVLSSQADVALTRAGNPVRALTPDVKPLASLLDETLPQGHTATDVGEAMLHVVTLGVSKKAAQRFVAPTDQDILRAAPKATHLATVLHTMSSCSSTEPCAEEVVLWQRPPPSPNEPLALVVTLVAADAVTLKTTVDLPPGPSLEARVAQALGPGERRLAGLGRHTASWSDPRAPRRSR